MAAISAELQAAQQAQKDLETQRAVNSVLMGKKEAMEWRLMELEAALEKCSTSAVASPEEERNAGSGVGAQAEDAPTTDESTQRGDGEATAAA